MDIIDVVVVYVDGFVVFFCCFYEEKGVGGGGKYLFRISGR